MKDEMGKTSKTTKFPLLTKTSHRKCRKLDKPKVYKRKNTVLLK